jgi:hypothetical protein
MRRSQIFHELSRLGDSETSMLNRPYEVLVARRLNARRAIIVYSGQLRRFWFSLNVLHQFLRRFEHHIIYLSDHTGHMYLNGLDSCGGSHDSLVAALRRTTAELGVECIHVMANSAGGFAGMRAALDLGAESFLGTGIRTDLTPGSRLPPGAVFGTAVQRCRDAKMLVNLRTLIEKAPAPPRIHLYCGANHTLDRAHAENLRGLPTVEVNVLEDESAHDIIGTLVGRGMFEDVLRRFIGP